MAVRASVALRSNPAIRIAFVGNHAVVLALIEAFNTSGKSPHRCNRFDTLAGGPRLCHGVESPLDGAARPVERVQPGFSAVAARASRAWRRHVAGGVPNSRLKARLKAASDS